MSALPSLNTPATFNTRIYYPDTLDIRRNLAIEELLFNGLRDGQCLLLLWRSHDSVVIGKNQNPWKECHLTSMRSAGVMMARRRSGGGTVYHDPENLNFTYLLERSHADAKRQTRVVIDALRDLGIPAEQGDRHVILVGGRKVSGNAFYYGKNQVLHHGTLLIDSDLDRLDRYLRPTFDNIQTRSIASVPVPVANLSEFSPGLSIKDVIRAIAARFEAAYADGVADAVALTDAALAPLYGKYSSWDWRFGLTPAFEFTGSPSFDWGAPAITISVVKSRIDTITVAGTGLSATATEVFADTLAGCRFDAGDIVARLDASKDGGGDARFADIAEWLTTLEF